MLQTTKSTQSGRNSAQDARGIVVINGQQVRFSSFWVEQNGFSAADTFELTLPFWIRDTQSNDQVLANGPGFTSMLLTLDTIPIQCYVGFPGNKNYAISDLTKVMDGFLDTARFSFTKAGEKVIINGRNVVGQMIDEKIFNKYPNQTSSMIATNFANEHSLTPVVTPTKTLAGVYYNNNTSVLGNETNEWDLLLYLAKQENFIVRVKNGQLLFGPYSVVTGYVSQTPIQYTWGYDIQELDIERSPQAARDIVVKVITYDRANMARIIETAKSTTQVGVKVTGQTGHRQQYIETYTIPGLTRDQAQKKAQAILFELSQRELIGNMTCSGNPDNAIDRQISLNGLGDTLSQAYYLNKVRINFDLDLGFENELSFSNQFLANGEPEADVTETSG